MDRTGAARCGVSVTIDDVPDSLSKIKEKQSALFTGQSEFGFEVEAGLALTMVMPTNVNCCPQYRLPIPYVVRFLPLYCDLLHPDDEFLYYLEHELDSSDAIEYKAMVGK